MVDHRGVVNITLSEVLDEIGKNKYWLTDLDLVSLRNIN